MPRGRSIRTETWPSLSANEKIAKPDANFPVSWAMVASPDGAPPSQPLCPDGLPRSWGSSPPHSCAEAAAVNTSHSEPPRPAPPCNTNTNSILTPPPSTQHHLPRPHPSRTPHHAPTPHAPHLILATLKPHSGSVSAPPPRKSTPPPPHTHTLKLPSLHEEVWRKIL